MNKSTKDFYVGVYGTLKRGKGNNHWLQDAEFVCTARTVGKRYMHGEGYGFPWMSKDEHEDGVHCLLEVFKADEANIANCDILEGYRGEGERNMYDRIVIPVQLNIKGNPIVDCFTYVGGNNNTSPSPDGNWNSTEIGDFDLNPNNYEAESN